MKLFRNGKMCVVFSYKKGVMWQANEQKKKRLTKKRSLLQRGCDHTHPGA